MKDIKIAEVLQREFHNRNISVNEAASLIGMPVRTLSGWATGKSLPSGKTLRHVYTISKFLGVSMQHLLFNIIDEEVRAEVIVSTTFKDGKNSFRLNIEKISEK